jgi:hypothetical protein
MGNPLVRFCRGTGEQPRLKPREAPVYSTLLNFDPKFIAKFNKVSKSFFNNER